MLIRRHYLAPLALALALAACVPPPLAPPSGGQAPATGGAATGTAPVAATDLKVLALPGGLDSTPVLNSNSPEVVKEDGVLVSTLAGGGAHLDYPFKGDFEIFSHHLADDAPGDPDACWLGLLARNDGTVAATVKLTTGASWLSRPDAPFLELAPVVDDPTGKVFAGPGGRVATDIVQGRSPLPATSWTLAPGETRALFTLPIPTTNRGVPNRNERSGLFRLNTDAPIRLAEVAMFGRADAPPAESALGAVLSTGKLAGTRDSSPTEYDPAKPPTSGAFRYGRVGGVSIGARWTGTLFERASVALPGAHDRIGFPIATVVLNTVGTRQIQAPNMAKRYPDTAIQAQGGYGVAYELAVPLDNPDTTPRTYAIAFTSPLKMSDNEPTAPMFMPPAGRRVTFRGPLRLDWQDEAGVAQHRGAHVVLHEGEAGPPFATVVVPPGKRYDAKLSLIYPADCTPPQLLTIERR